MMEKKFNIIKIITIILAFAMMFASLSACVQKAPDNNNSSTPSDSDVSSEETPSDDEEEIIDDPSSEEVPEDEDYAEETTVYPLKVFNGSKPIMTNYRGMSSTVYHAFGYMKDDKTGRVYTDEMLDIELDRLEETGTHFCRTRFNTQWIWSNTLGNWDFNTNRAGYFYEYCNDLQDRNIEIVLQLGWHSGFAFDDAQASIPEAEYLRGKGENINGEGKDFDYSNLDEKHIRMSKAALRFGDVYTKLLKELKSRGINNVSHLIYFTEPSFIRSGDQLEGPTAEEYLYICQIIKKVLVENGVADWVGHIGPNQATNTTSAGLLSYVLERDTNLFDVYSSHCYPSGSSSITNNVYFDIYQPIWEAYTEALEPYGLLGKNELWVDEYQPRDSTFASGKPPESAWFGLQSVVGALAAQQQGISNISTWQIFDQLWTDQTNTNGEFTNGIHYCGTAPSLFVSSIPRGSYYINGLFTRYNGYKDGTVYKTTIADYSWESGLYIGAVQLDDGNWTITVVNAEMADAAFTVEFEKAIGKTLYRHTENANTLVPDSYAYIADVDKYYVNVGTKFADTLPGGTVAIYTTVKK